MQIFIGGLRKDQAGQESNCNQEQIGNDGNPEPARHQVGQAGKRGFRIGSQEDQRATNKTVATRAVPAATDPIRLVKKAR